MKRRINTYNSFLFYVKFRGRQFYIEETGQEVDKFEVLATYRRGEIRMGELIRNTGWIRSRQKPGWRLGKRRICVM